MGYHRIITKIRWLCVTAVIGITSSLLNPIANADVLGGQEVSTQNQSIQENYDSKNVYILGLAMVFKLNY